MDNLTASDIASRLVVCSNTLSQEMDRTTVYVGGGCPDVLRSRMVPMPLGHGRLLLQVPAEWREDVERIFDEGENEIDDWLAAVRLLADPLWFEASDGASVVTRWKVRTLFGGTFLQAVPDEVEADN